MTFNLRDFPDASVTGFDLEVVHPDDFLLDQLDLHRAPTLRAIVDLADEYDSPAMTVDGFLLALERSGVPRFAAAVGERLE
ncbi:hypothetical protein [Galactobacter sp.]|uniref:hypothetical protein n=1 Tax=Galactobacter sp. TaxID=2676125 RepID=UPI0025BC2C18|nr:hypothetical protein [Galactobacter sp.]